MISLETIRNDAEPRLVILESSMLKFSQLPNTDLRRPGRQRSAVRRCYWLETARLPYLAIAAWLTLTCGLRSQDTPVETPAVSQSDPEKEVAVGVAVGGFRRYVPQRWGMVSASVYNRSKQEASGLIVVTPRNSGGVQFARKVSVPPEMQFSTSWPVKVDGLNNSSLIDFEYLYFPSGEEDGNIRRQNGDSGLPTVTGMMSEGLRGISGVIISNLDKERTTLQHLIRAMRFNKLGESQVAILVPSEMTSQREYLDALDQLAIGDPELLNFPQACDSIRSWVCRGGRLLIAMEECGPDVAQHLLGSSLTLSIVGEAFPTTVKLDLNPEYQENQYPVRSVTREFVEPIRYLRVIASAGEPIWYVDGWPVAIRIPMGLGTVVITTIQPDAFIEPRQIAPGKAEASYGMIASSRRMLDSIFHPRNPLPITQEMAAAHAAELVGYQVPDRSIATFLLILFPILLVIAGIVLQRKEQGQQLVWLLPAVSIAAAIPAVVMGARMRAVAPMTVIETSMIASTPGETQLAADGFASVYLPDPATVAVSSSNGTTLDLVGDPTNQDYKRVVWDDPLNSHWENLQQHVGLKTHMIAFEKPIPAAIQATGTFDENGLRGTLSSTGLTLSSPLLLAAENRVHLSLESNGSDFHGAPGDLLAAGQYFKSSFVSEESRSQAALLAGFFGQKDSQELFPAQPTLFFWIDPENSDFKIGDDSVRRRQSALVAQPLQLTPPEAGKLVTIPAPFLPYKSIVTETGSFSSVFNNQTRLWGESESASSTRLQIDAPQVCRPFEVASVQVTVTMRAASRRVTFRWGDPKTGMQDFQSMDSPLGTFSLTVPPELITKDRSGKLFLEFHVSEIGGHRSDDASGEGFSSGGEQDDSWKIDRLLLTVTGRRIPISPAAN